MDDFFLIPIIIFCVMATLMFTCFGICAVCAYKNRHKRNAMYSTPVVVTSQSYIPPSNNQQPQFPVIVQASVQSPSAPPADNSSTLPFPHNHLYNTQRPPSQQLPYPPSPNQQNRAFNPPYPTNGNNSQFPASNDSPPSYDQVKQNKF